MHREPSAPHRTGVEMLEEAADLGAGAAVVLLPLLVIALPGVVLMLVLPAVLILGALAAPVAIAGLLLAPPYLLLRARDQKPAPPSNDPPASM